MASKLDSSAKGYKRKRYARLWPLPVFCFLAAAPAQAQTVIYQETFDGGNVTGPAFATRDIPAYVGPGPLNMTYTADPAWNGSTGCNGIVGAWASSATDANAVASCVGGANPPSPQAIWNFAQINLLALGGFNANRPTGATLNNATATNAEKQNIGLTAYTNGNPGAPNLILRNVSPIPLPASPVGGTGRFVTFRVTAAAVNCPPVASAPLITANLNGTQIGGTINLCSSPSPNVRSYTVAARPDSAIAGATAVVRVGDYFPTGAGASLVMGGGLTVSMVNQNASGGGNDWALDNFAAADVTPSVTKAVDTPISYVGQVKRLTFTITNTNGDNLPKVGWGFTDTLPANVVIAPIPNATTTCGAGTAMTAVAGAGTFTVSAGNLPGGTAGGVATTCTVSVNVVSNVAGIYNNGAANFTTSVGLNLPVTPISMEWVVNRLTLTKVSTGNIGSFAFSGNNGIADHTIVTTAPDLPGTAGPQQTLTVASTTANTTVTEAPPPGWAITAVACTGLAAGQTATFAGNGVTIPFAGLSIVSGGRDVACTITNTLSSNLTITKSNTYTAAQPSDLPGDTVAAGANTTYTLVVTNAGPGTVTGAVVRDAPGAGITCPAGNAVTITGDGVPAGSFNIGQLTSAAGIALGTLNAGQSTTLSFTCTVN
ncbi:hypothetical protein V1318_17695 [Lysobacter sp. CCNWLW3]|uniref:DUF7933 domain-containing protein n=3 Tax=Lysobacter TaxID=68 RepID=UPI002FD51D30